MATIRLIILIIFFLSDYFRYGLGIPYTANVCLILIIIDLIIFKTKFNKLEQKLIIFTILFLIISILVWESTYTIYSYIGIFPVLWLFKKIRLKKIENFFIVAIYVNLILAGYEYLTETYIYEAVADANGANVNLSYSELSGNVKRAKGVFPGPLSLANFAVGSILIFPKNRILVIGSLLICLFANARLGILISGLIYLIYNNRINLQLLMIFGILFYLFSYTLDESGISRFINVFDVTSPNNQARLFYMFSAIELFLNYPIINVIFGNSGKLLATVGNNAENGWLTLLVENGIVGFLFYSILLVSSMVKVRLSNFKSKIPLFLLVVIMSVQTFYLSILGPFWFWLPILIHNKKEKVHSILVS